jgi:hypothetical protein
MHSLPLLLATLQQQQQQQQHSPEASLHLLGHAQVGQRHTAQPNIDAPPSHVPVLQRCCLHLLNTPEQNT